MKKTTLLLLTVAGCVEQEVKEVPPPAPSHLVLVSTTGVHHSSIYEVFDEEHHIRCYVTEMWDRQLAISCLKESP